MNRKNEEWGELRRRREAEENAFAALRETTKRLEETAKDARGADASSVSDGGDFGAENGVASEGKTRTRGKRRNVFKKAFAAVDEKMQVATTNYYRRKIAKVFAPSRFRVSIEAQKNWEFLLDGWTRLGELFQSAFKSLEQELRGAEKRLEDEVFASSGDGAAAELASLLYSANSSVFRRLQTSAENVSEMIAQTRMGVAKAVELELLELEGTWKVKLFGVNAPMIAKKWWTRSAPLAVELAASFDELAKTLRTQTATLTAALRAAIAEIEKAEATGNGERAAAVLRDFIDKMSLEKDDFSEIGDGKDWRK